MYNSQTPGHKIEKIGFRTKRNGIALRSLFSRHRRKSKSRIFGNDNSSEQEIRSLSAILKQQILLSATLTIGLLQLGCGIDRSNLLKGCEFELVAPAESVEISSALKFDLVPPDINCQLIWSVEDTLGGTPSTGMITQQGLFVSPPAVPASRTVRICASAVNDTTVRCKDLLIIDAPQSLHLIPKTAKVAVQDSLKLFLSPKGCNPGAIVWSLEKIVGDSIGGITEEGIYYAPKRIGSSVSVMVMATAQECSGKIGVARIELTIRRFVVQAEDFTDSQGIGIDGTISCNEGKGVTGLDSMGEWIEIPIDVPDTGVYRPWIWYASSYKDTLELSMVTFGCSEDSSPTGFVLKDGTGAIG